MGQHVFCFQFYKLNNIIYILVALALLKELAVQSLAPQRKEQTYSRRTGYGRTRSNTYSNTSSS